jgi:hypothetical protein
MALKLPRKFVGAAASGGIDALQYEIAQEKAGVLARLGRQLQAALERLDVFDAAARAGSAAAAEERDALVGAAGEALWYFVVQREVLGLRDTDAVMRELRVPREVRLRMGLNRRSAKP